MGKKKFHELMTVQELVKCILETYPQTRSNDNILYLFILGYLGQEKGIDFDKVSVSDFLHNSSKWGIPCFETVRRTRQKIQAKNPHLAADEKVEEFRAENEQAYRGYALQE